MITFATEGTFCVCIIVPWAADNVEFNRNNEREYTNKSTQVRESQIRIDTRD